MAKMKKTNCTICKKEIECPENMMKAKFHICGDCFEKDGALSVLDMDPKKVHLDLPMEDTKEVMAEQISWLLADSAFEELWEDTKKELKGVSQKELCKNMFAAGAYIATVFGMDAMENPPKIKAKKKTK